MFHPQAWAYRIDQQWKELNFGPLQIFFCLLLFNGELRQLAAAANPNQPYLPQAPTRTLTLPRRAAPAGSGRAAQLGD